MIAKLRGERKGEHIHARLFMGPDRDHLAKNGDLVLTVEEWQIFVAALLLGEGHTDGHLVVEVDDPLAKEPSRVYYYRGQIERWLSVRLGYVWCDAYSENTEDGRPVYPWSTMKECRDAARKDGIQAIFQRRS